MISNVIKLDLNPSASQVNIFALWNFYTKKTAIKTSYMPILFVESQQATASC